jgi:hypothetical protein
LAKEELNGGLLRAGLRGLLRFIFEGRGDDPLSLLKEDFLQEKALASHLSDHARSMPYGHYRDRLLELAGMSEEASELLAKKIRAMGSGVPEVSEPEPLEGTLWEKLAGDVDQLNRLYYRYMSQGANRDDEELKELLDRLHQDKNEQSVAIQRLASGLHGYSL